ncbi:hypothetical protein [Microbacterium enclense]|uniref:hypothetical protein n=1 Tax=Microbacterium enclense TaxID=993073 RepID=UPI003F7EDBDC
MDAMRHGRGSRVARGAVAASVATFVALVSHVSAGGAIPGVVGVVVPLALSFVVCTALAGRAPSIWRSVLAVAASQGLFHTLFVLGSYDLGAGGHVHGGAVSITVDAASAPEMTMDAAMAGAHLVAAAVTAAALHRGERAFAALRSLAVRCVAWMRARLRAVGFSPVPLRRLRAAVLAEVRPISVLVVRARARRGPPVAAS